METVTRQLGPSTRVVETGLKSLRHAITRHLTTTQLITYSYSYKILKQELKTVKVNSEKHTQVYGMYRAV